jgi:5'/3'-nucleotidase
MTMLRLHSLGLLSAGSLALLLLATPANAINILLSNDDGYNAPGIVALKEALEEAGHNITVVAPSGNRSGSSVALTFGPFEVLKISKDVYSVDSTPANTVKFGAYLLTGSNRPDLVVSGINSGANIGPSTVISGTVGNVIAAIEEVDAPIPGIAFSTNLVEPDASSEANRRHFHDVAAFAAKLVSRFTRTGQVQGLLPGQALNVNYPGTAPRLVKGVKVAVQGLAPNFTNDYQKIDATHYSLASKPIHVIYDVRNSDTILFQEGYVTIVPIDGDYTASRSVTESLRPYLDTLTP